MVNATLETHKNKQIFSIHIMTHSFHSSFLPSFPFILYLLYNIVNHIFMCEIITHNKTRTSTIAFSYPIYYLHLPHIGVKLISFTTLSTRSISPTFELN